MKLLSFSKNLERRRKYFVEKFMFLLKRHLFTLCYFEVAFDFAV